MQQLLITLLILGLSLNLHASTILVDSTDDTITADGNCTLREALAAANFNIVIDQCTAGQPSPVQDLIELLPNALNEGLQLDNQQPIIETVHVRGPGSDRLTLFPGMGHDGHLFQINTTGQDSVRLSGFTLGGARSSAIEVVASDELIVDDLVFNNNQAINNGTSGGAIAGLTGGWIRVYDSEFTNNQANLGGAIHATDFLIEVVDSHFNNNTATQGGAIYSYGPGTTGVTTFNIRRSQFTQNHNAIEAGIHKLGVYESVFYQNTGDHSFRAVFNSGRVINNLFAENTSTHTYLAEDQSGGLLQFNTFTDNQGFEISAILGSAVNIQRSLFDTNNGCFSDANSSLLFDRNIDLGTSCSGMGAGDISNTDPLLLPTAYYGGDLLMAPPSPVSPAVDLDDTTACDNNSDDLSGEGRPRDGDGSGGLGQCDYGAVERPNAYGLSVSFPGNGSGSVSLAEFGLICQAPASCLWPLPRLQTFNLLPDADTGSTFIEWGGACQGDQLCNINMNGFKILTARFDLVASPVTLTVNKFPSQPNAGVTINSTPAGIHCGASCAAGFIENDLVSLEADPDPGTQVDAWTGCDAISGDGLTCSKTLTDDSQISVFYSLNPDVIFATDFED